MRSPGVYRLVVRLTSRRIDRRCCSCTESFVRCMQFSIVPYDLKDLFPCIRSVRIRILLPLFLLATSVIFIVQLYTLSLDRSVDIDLPLLQFSGLPVTVSLFLSRKLF